MEKSNFLSKELITMLCQDGGSFDSYDSSYHAVGGHRVGFFQKMWFVSLSTTLQKPVLKTSCQQTSTLSSHNQNTRKHVTHASAQQHLFTTAFTAWRQSVACLCWWRFTQATSPCNDIGACWPSSPTHQHLQPSYLSCCCTGCVEQPAGGRAVVHITASVPTSPDVGSVPVLHGPKALHFLTA